MEVGAVLAPPGILDGRPNTAQHFGWPKQHTVLSARFSEQEVGRRSRPAKLAAEALPNASPANSAATTISAEPIVPPSLSAVPF